ncbi:hypothetical protein MRX96_046245, partial [Rhipicephalus microplus]
MGAIIFPPCPPPPRARWPIFCDGLGRPCGGGDVEAGRPRNRVGRAWLAAADLSFRSWRSEWITPGRRALAVCCARCLPESSRDETRLRRPVCRFKSRNEEISHVAHPMTHKSHQNKTLTGLLTLAEMHQVRMATNVGYPQTGAKGVTAHVGGAGDSPQHAQLSREERLRLVKERQEEQRARRLQELEQQAQAAQHYREQLEEERRRRIEEMRQRDHERRLQVEERKRLIWEADHERKEAMLKRNMEREGKLDARRSTANRMSMSFAFGSSTPRTFDLDLATMSSAGAPVLMSAAPQRKSEERDFESSRKRAASAYNLCQAAGEDPMTRSMTALPSQHSRGRRKTDLMPVIPWNRSCAASRSRSPATAPSSSSGVAQRAVSMSRLDVLAQPRRPRLLPASPSTSAATPPSMAAKSMLNLSSGSPPSRRGGHQPDDGYGQGATVAITTSFLHVGGIGTLGGLQSDVFISGDASKATATKASATQHCWHQFLTKHCRVGRMSPQIRQHLLWWRRRRRDRPAVLKALHPRCHQSRPTYASHRSLSHQRPPAFQERATLCSSCRCQKCHQGHRAQGAAKGSPLPASLPTAAVAPIVASAAGKLVPVAAAATVAEPNTAPPDVVASNVVTAGNQKQREPSTKKSHPEAQAAVDEQELKAPAVTGEVLATTEPAEEQKSTVPQQTTGGPDSCTQPATQGPSDPSTDEGQPSKPAPRVISEEEARALLAEKRRLAREQAEREAELERLRQEELRRQEEERLRQEEEEQRRAEEEQLRLAEEFHRQEEEKLQRAIEEQQKREAEERERRELEAQQKAEREEQERKAREEAERQR